MPFGASVDDIYREMVHRHALMFAEESARAWLAECERLGVYAWQRAEVDDTPMRGKW